MNTTLSHTDTLLSYISYNELSRDEGKAWYFGAKVPTFLPAPSENGMNVLMAAIQSSDLDGYIQHYLTVSDEQMALHSTLEQLREHTIQICRLSTRWVKKKRGHAASQRSFN